MDRFLCIHGHFYQPPREDPWLGAVLPEGSAAPSANWNERICRESYAPLSRARRLDGAGRIMDIFNLYEWISFNFGPTLCRWMESRAPETLARVVEGDRAGLTRLGHGNALAQVCHHVILPLASDLDKHLEVGWAVADFRHRFGRDPEGMWLSEAAVDTASLEVLAENGIRFTVLAPCQAAFVADLDGGNRRAVSEWDMDISRPYRAVLPSGRYVDIFFYHGGLSQAVAFERLLADGENFWRRLSGAAGPGLLALATDGETYGHHFQFGEMALAYVMAQAASGRDGLSPTNFGAYLAKHPPQHRVWLREPSAWSCVHGVERWRSDCGCTNGEHPGYNQKWRGPLRAALDLLKAEVDAHYFSAAGGLFHDPKAALLAYGEVLCGAMDKAGFEAARFVPGLAADKRSLAWTLLSMQRFAVSSFASCAWFFDELTRIEPVNALTYALRAMDLARETGMADPEARFLAELEKAESNDPAMGNGRDVWNNLVAPRRATAKTLALQTFLTLEAEDRLPVPGGPGQAVAWPAVTAAVRLDAAADGHGHTGTFSLDWTLESRLEQYGVSLTIAQGGGLFGGPAAPSRPGGGGPGAVGSVVVPGVPAMTDPREAVGGLEGAVGVLVPLDLLEDHLVCRKVALLGHPIEYPPVLGVVEVEVEDLLGLDPPHRGASPEEVPPEPQGLVDLEAEADVGHEGSPGPAASSSASRKPEQDVRGGIDGMIIYWPSSSINNCSTGLSISRLGRRPAIGGIFKVDDGHQKMRGNRFHGIKVRNKTGGVSRRRRKATPSFRQNLSSRGGGRVRRDDIHPPTGDEK